MSIELNTIWQTYNFLTSCYIVLFQELLNSSFNACGSKEIVFRVGHSDPFDKTVGE